MTQLPVPEPRTELGPSDYWAAAATGTLTVAHCRRCDRMIWYPRERCPACMSGDVELRAVSGEGTVYSYTVNRRPTGAYRGLDAVVLAYVELAEGPRVLTNLVGADPAEVRIGMPVTAFFDVSTEGAAVLRFRPASADAGGPEAEGEGRT